MIFLPYKILRVQAPQKLYPNSHACLVAHNVEKLREVIPLGTKVIATNTLNFKPISEIPLLEIVACPQWNVGLHAFAIL